MNAADKLFLEYCATDCCTTAECNTALDPLLSPRQRDHYSKLNMALVPAVLYMQMRGIRYDSEGAAQRLKRVERWIAVLQGMLNRAAGVQLPTTEQELVKAIKQAGLVLTKPRKKYEIITPERTLKNGKVKAGSVKVKSEVASVETLEDCLVYAKDSGREALEQIRMARSLDAEKSRGLVGAGVRSNRALRNDTNLASALSLSLNVNSTNAGGDSQRFLYEICWVPKSWKAGKGWQDDWGGWQAWQAASQIHQASTEGDQEVEQEQTFKLGGKDGGVDEAESISSELGSGNEAGLASKRSFKTSEAAQLLSSNAGLRGGLLTSWPLIPHQTEQTALIEVNGAKLERRLDHCRMLFPKQFKKEGNKLTTKLTSNNIALLKLWIATRDKRVMLFLRLRALLTATKTLRATTDEDGRIRCGIIIPGTKTGRFAVKKSPTGSGYNLQTVTDDHRYLFRADEGHLLGQADLKGADGWTVGAECLWLGDPTMMDDLIAGLKPAFATVLMMEHGAGINKLPREKLLEMAGKIKKTYWLAVACKAAIWSICYGVGEKTISDGILKNSYKETGRPIFVDVPTCKQIKMAVMARYPGIQRRMDWIKQIMGQDGTLTSSLGFKRAFHGWRDWRYPQRAGDASATQREMLAHMPQVMTTGATKLALLRLWTDPENWLADEQRLRVEPLLTVHDSLLTQFKVEDKEWARAKHKEWFHNPIKIATSDIVINFDGTIGPDWGMKGAEKI